MQERPRKDSALNFGILGAGRIASRHADSIGTEGRKSLALVLAMYRSAREGREVRMTEL